MMSWQGDAVTQARERGSEQTAGSDEVLAFWRAAGPDKWFKKDPAFDQEMAARFLAVWEAAAGGKLGAWRETPESALALVIALDQFSRNMFRGQSSCYDCDRRARAVPPPSLARGFDRKIAHA